MKAHTRVKKILGHYAKWAFRHSRTKIGTLVPKVCNQWPVLRIFSYNACLSDENDVLFYRISWLVVMLHQFHLCLELCHNVCLPGPQPARRSAAASCLFAVEIFSIDTRKERCPLCYVHFSASRALALDPDPVWGWWLAGQGSSPEQG